MVGAGGVDGVPATGADAEHAEAPGVDPGRGVERVERVADVLAPPVRVLEIARLTTTAALMGGVDDERGDAAVGETAGVVGADLFLDAAARGRQHHGRHGRRPAGVGRQVEVGGELDGPARDRDVLQRHGSPSV
ncbi:hypothetical protein [Pseudonocardia sp. ICBG1293]|uniref:hypothetical protein n=1 Tax=Pseudonocardia sp. ICBG1293 TaxID=2844382 RepID=UPI001CCDAE56|nr:hypothetical protein [Pseudonocardia sp. ICBG1293]